LGQFGDTTIEVVELRKLDSSEVVLEPDLIIT